jgi:predicted nucleotide-binding protein
VSELSDYIKRIPNFALLARQPSKLVPYFSLFLELQDENVVITPSGVDSVFNEARVRRPANTSDVIRKSRLFVKAPGRGYRLSHEGRDTVGSSLEADPSQGHLKIALTASKPPSDAAVPAMKEAPLLAPEAKRNVFVVYGRDERLRTDLFSLLRAFGLNPIEFEEMAQFTGSTSPHLWEILQAGFKHSQACVVLLSPDELVELRPGLRKPTEPRLVELQPRQNVLIEAGMALALHPTRTILVRVGNVRPISDLDGKHYVSLDGSADSRNKLRNKLTLAECDVKTHNGDWLKVGDFKPSEL